VSGEGTELVKIRYNPQTRASSPTDPVEWTITEDGYLFGKGDRVWNYYDGEWVYVREDPAQTDTGWFYCSIEPDGPASILLNSVRVSAVRPSR